MASKAASPGRIRSAVVLHWFTHFVSVHGRLPKAATTFLDFEALDDIVDVQALRHEDRALTLIEEIIRAPIPGDSLHARYVAFWAWVKAREPKRYSPPSRSVRTEIVRCIRGAA